MKLIRMRIALFVMLTSATCLSHASMSWRIAITAATLAQYAALTFGVQYCDSQLSWKEFLSLSILSSTLGRCALVLENYATNHYLTDYLVEFAAGRNLTQEELRNEAHKKLMSISKQNSIPDALVGGALSLMQVTNCMNLVEVQTKKLRFFLGQRLFVGC